MKYGGGGGGGGGAQVGPGEKGQMWAARIHLGVGRCHPSAPL